jgi:hypothetical protein
MPTSDAGPLNELRRKLLQNKEEPKTRHGPELYIPYKRSVSLLFENIKKWIEPLSKEGLLSLEPGAEILIKEEYVVDYEIPEAWLKGPGVSIELKPIGCMILGAKGRLDMISKGRATIIILNDEDQWNLVNRSRKPMLSPLNASAFLELIDQITN